MSWSGPNTAVQAPMSNLSANYLSSFPGINMGDPSEKGQKFCPWKLIRAYPYLYVGKQNYEEVEQFFKHRLFEERIWDLFCLLDPGENGRDPLLLVPSYQFEEFLSYVNSHTKLQLHIPYGGAKLNFFATFGDWDTPLPRFLGRAESNGAIEELRLRTHRLPTDDLFHLSDIALQSYRDKMNDLYNSFKSRKKKADAEVSKKKRIDRQKRYGKMVKRAQRYLGLRSPRGYSALPHANLNADMPAFFRAQNSVRFVCVDIEAWERATHVVTEVGLAILDTYDTMNVPPGKDGHDWFPLITSHHFRISEHLDKINYAFVQGCPHLFNFGNSEVVRTKDISRVIGSIIGDDESRDRRPVIMVGHDIGQDLNYLTKVGYNIWNVPQFSDEMDTQSMHQRLNRSPNGRGLSTICEELGVPGRNFHNAGNDATYTLRAMIVIAIRQMAESSGKKKENDADKPGKSEEDEWSDGEMDDGGPPQKSFDPLLQST